MFSWATQQLDALGVNTQAIQELVESVAPVAGPEQRFASALVQGDQATVMYALNSGELNMNATLNQSSGSRLIHVASANNSRQVIDYLISQNVSVDTFDSQGDVPLHYAAKNGHIDLVKLFVSLGASVRIKNARGKMPYDVCERHQYVRQFLLPIQLQAETEEQARNGTLDPRISADSR